MSLTEIKTAIEALSEKERCELNAWLQDWPADDWDRQMEADARSGRFTPLAREAEDAILAHPARTRSSVAVSRSIR
ncbi:MAG: hypothetical protein HZB26_12565 [Candidatus Hydrogenedentes bacterium]|nr:hypothetical protein [Candidatus Hydrogenedentota bacterium]